MANILKAAVLLSTFLLLALSCEGDRNIDPVLQKTIDEVIQGLYLPLSNISGMGLAIVQNDGELLYTTGYGLADQEKGIPNGNDTQFLIGSTSKSVVSTVIVKVLHEKFPEMGEAVLDAPIRKLIPEANFTLIDRFRSEQASFRDLVAHRLCLFREDFQMISQPFDSPSEIVYRQRYNHEICSVRTDFQYNNQMYVAAGELIGMIAGKSLDDLVQELLTEIGMMNSTFIKADDDFSQMPYRGQPYYVMDNISYPVNPELIKRVVPDNAAGGLYLTPNDMAKYARFRLNLGKIDGKQVVPEECMKWMIKPSNFLPAAGFKSSPNDLVRSSHAYGLGLMLGSYNGWEQIHHGGYFPPYHTLMSLFPAKNLSIFTSTNMGPAYIGAQLLHEAIFNIITGGDNAEKLFLEEVHKLLKADNEEKSRTEQSLKKLIEQHEGNHVSTNIVGKYGSGSSGDLEIVERFNEDTNATGLYISYGKWIHGFLNSVAGNLYKVMLDTDVVQDNFAGGSKDTWMYCLVTNETVEFVSPTPTENISLGTFKSNVTLDSLPIIPWSPDSCGIENQK